MCTVFQIHWTLPQVPEATKQNEPRGPAPAGSAEPKLRESCWPGQIPAHPLLVVAGRMRSSSTAPLTEKMACPAPDATVAADPGGAGPFRSSEEPEGREPDGVRFDRERARLLWEAVSGAQPAGREEGESGAPGFAAGPRRDGLPPVTPLAPANLCTTIRSSELRARSLSLSLAKSAGPHNSLPCGIFPSSFRGRSLENSLPQILGLVLLESDRTFPAWLVTGPASIPVCP